MSKRRSASANLTIPADVMRDLGWTDATPLNVNCRLAWTDTPDGRVAQCLTVTICAARESGRRRPTRKVA